MKVTLHSFGKLAVFFTAVVLLCAMGVATLPLTSSSAAITEKAYSFNGKNGGQPGAGLVFDDSGNLYGTTNQGGIYSDECIGGSCGVVFELTSDGNGVTTEKVLYSFPGGNNLASPDDGSNPEGGLIFDGAGSLYGTAYIGGTAGNGIVFELKPGDNGQWIETVLYNFQDNGQDGQYPWAGLTFDKAGNLYGTTYLGGTGGCFAGSGCGTVFELTPQSDGSWSESVLYSFQNNGKDGTNPLAGLVLDSAGNLYGTTSTGGGGGCHLGCGTVFEVSPKSGRGWSEKALHRFRNDREDGELPFAGLVLDAYGNLYGTTEFGGSDGLGTVFQLSPKSGGGWYENVLHSFGRGQDGYRPTASVIFDSAGSLYGTTNMGGSADLGTIFRLKAGANGKWTENFYSFNGPNGALPYSNVIFDGAGNLYGTTQAGGSYDVCHASDFIGCGVAFELKASANTP